MKKTMFALIGILFMGSTIWNGMAQAQTLTEEQKKIFQDRVKQKVEDFQYEMTQIVNVKLSDRNRAEGVRNLLNLFIGRGDPYQYNDYDYQGNVIKRHSSGVTMEVSSVNRRKTTTKKLKEYIYEFFNPVTFRSKKYYSQMRVEYSDALRVDNIERVGDHYECVAYFVQRFYGYRDGRVVYSDQTGKKIRCYINHIELPTGGEIWDAKLGDIYVVSTERIN